MRKARVLFPAGLQAVPPKQREKGAFPARVFLIGRASCFRPGKAWYHMKLILAIVSNDDSGAVSSALTRGGYSVTKLATTGGFLMAGNTTFISGVEDDKVDDVIGIISKYSSRRTQIVPSTSTMEVGMYSSFPVEVTVGGSTIFVLNVDRFEKV